MFWSGSKNCILSFYSFTSSRP